MVIPNRQMSSNGGDYRFGFNGMEKDDEVRGEGNALEFGGRSIYDSRLGRFVSIDPWSNRYPWQTSYAYYSNSPTSVIDQNGLGGDDNKPITTEGSLETGLNTVSNPEQGDKYTVNHSPEMYETTQYGQVISGTRYKSDTRVYHEGNQYADAGWYGESDYEYVNRDWAGGQVLAARNEAVDFLLGGRKWNGYQVKADGYIDMSKVIILENASDGSIHTFPIRELGGTVDIGIKSRSLKSVGYLARIAQAERHLNKKGIYSVYSGWKQSKNGEILLYIGKAKNGISSRYTIAKLSEYNIEALHGLSKVPNNGIALGAEQLIMNLNGWGKEGALANRMPATTNPVMISEATKWLDSNIKNWRTVLKFQ